MTRVASRRPSLVSSRCRSPSIVTSPSRSIRATVCDTVGPDWCSRSADPGTQRDDPLLDQLVDRAEVHLGGVDQVAHPPIVAHRTRRRGRGSGRWVQDDSVTEFTISAKHCGPPRSGNGGWTAGALAAMLSDAPAPLIEATLRLPPPLDVAMEVWRSSGLGGARVRRAHGRRGTGYGRCRAPPCASRACLSGAGRGGVVRGAHASPLPELLRVRHRSGRRAGGSSRAGLADPARVAATWTPSPSTAGAVGRPGARLDREHLGFPRLRRRLGLGPRGAPDGPGSDHRPDRQPA